MLDAAAAKRVRGKREVDTGIQAGPVFANGRLYVLTRHRLYAIAAGPAGRPD